MSRKIRGRCEFDGGEIKGASLEDAAAASVTGVCKGSGAEGGSIVEGKVPSVVETGEMNSIGSVAAGGNSVVTVLTVGSTASQWGVES